MSGGFFRGTSADQDTRFSNKQAKLLKTQKFAPELENLVDMTKVKMDVMRPWIAHRVTELLGFEDEVLINFIYGLLEEKLVNGKEIQISLTGFMEKNTGKFMKELWTHLLSAQKNASGVPQQFLDAKEEETKKKQADADRTLGELKRTKEKEGRELEQEKMKKMDGEVENGKAAALESHSRSHMKVSSTWSVDEKEANEKNGSKARTRGRRSRSFSSSPSPPRSRSLSASPKPVKRSVSSERRHHSPSRRSFTPRGVGSPPRSISPRRRSVSRSRRRSPSPIRRRFSSPVRRRSRSPVRRRPRSPMWRRSRSPLRRRSRSPIRRRSRSPIRRRPRSPSPMQYRSRSPMGRRSRSPLRCISESPLHSGSPSPVRRRSPSPMRRRYRRSPSPMRHRTTFSSRRRSSSPRSISSSPRVSRSPIRRRPPSPMGRRSPMNLQRSPVESPRNGSRIVQNSSVRQAPRKENSEHPFEDRKKFTSSAHLPPVSVRSPERDLKGRRISQIREPALSPSRYNSPRSRSPPPTRRRSPSEDRSPVAPMRKRDSMHINNNLESLEVEEKRFSRGQEDKRHEKKEPMIDKYEKKRHSTAGLASHHSSEIRAQKKTSETDGRRRYPELTDEPLSERARNSEKRTKADEMYDLRKNDVKHNLRNQEAPRLPKVEKIDQRVLPDSGSDESDERRKHKRSKRKDVTSDDEDYSHDSDRKEAKRRRKEEKKLKKEEKRKRREERRRRKEDRRNEKRKLKAAGNYSQSSDSEKNHGAGGYDSDGGAPRSARVARDEAFSDQKKLEIKLREKALESLRAKRGIGH